jgi:hypothetical protein
MELKEFVTETIVQITQGVKDAQEQIKDTGALINPMTWDSNGGILSGIRNGCRNTQNIKMDIAVTVMENSGKKAGIGIVASVFKVGASNEESDSNSTTSRIEFNVPISLPVMENDPNS